MITWLDYLSSYFRPVTIARKKSAISGELEVTLEYGRRLLNTTKVNYSGGSLFDVFEQTFEELGLKKIKFKSVLILGFGTGSVLELFAKHPELRITGVELDPAVIELGKQYFNWHTHTHLTVIQADAFTFIQNTAEKYDLILVDVFVNDTVPAESTSPEFWKNIRQMMLPNGYCLLNRMLTAPAARNHLNNCAQYAQNLFSSQTTIYCLDNAVLACKNELTA